MNTQDELHVFVETDPVLRRVKKGKIYKQNTTNGKNAGKRTNPTK